MNYHKDDNETINLEGAVLPGGRLNDCEVNVKHIRQQAKELFGGRILIIEDNAYVREAFELTLQRTCLNAHVVTTAEEAMQAVQQHVFDIIICDYRLPGMDGIEFFDRAKPYTRNASKVLTSAYGFDDLDTDTDSIPVDRFVLKPFSIHRLLFELNGVTQTFSD